MTGLTEEVLKGNILYLQYVIAKIFNLHIFYNDTYTNPHTFCKFYLRNCLNRRIERLIFQLFLIMVRRLIMNQKQREKENQQKNHNQFNNVTQKVEPENQNQEHNVRKEGIFPINHKK